jgi:hypothetical protein
MLVQSDQFSSGPPAHKNKIKMMSDSSACLCKKKKKQEKE